MYCRPMSDTPANTNEQESIDWGDRMRQLLTPILGIDPNLGKIDGPKPVSTEVTEFT